MKTFFTPKAEIPSRPKQGSPRSRSHWFFPGLLLLLGALNAEAQIDATVSFAPPSSMVTEGGTFTIQVNLSNPLSYNLTVYAARIDGTATAADFFTCTGPCTENQRIATIPAGSTSGTFTVPTLDDLLDEDSPESCTLRIDNTDQAARSALARSVFTR